MQNKPNPEYIGMNLSYVKTKNYEQNTMEEEPTKQTQSKPNDKTPKRRVKDMPYVKHQTSYIKLDSCLRRNDIIIYEPPASAKATAGKSRTANLHYRFAAAAKKD